MARFRYVGDGEHLRLGPPARVLSPGDIVESTTNPDPALFTPIGDPAAARATGPDVAAGADPDEFAWAVDWILEDHRPVRHDD